MSEVFIACFMAAGALTLWLLATNKYLPGQDISYHAHCSRVWLDGGRAGSPYAAYEAVGPLEANTLMYTVTGFFSHLGSSFGAYRWVQAYYLLGLPLACLYALRALGRSPWGSLLGFPLCYGEVFAAGYANNAFAAPTFIVALVEYWRFVRRPTWRRGVFVAALFVATFLSHAQVYLWLGGLLLLYSVPVLFHRIGRAFVTEPRVGLRDLFVFVFGGAAVAAPSLVIFARWYARGYGAGNSVGAQGNNVSFEKTLSYVSFSQKYQGGALQAFSSTTSVYEALYLVGLGILVVLSMTLARAARDRTVPIAEFAIVATVVSFYALPDEVARQMIAVRQWYVVFWLLPLIVVPVPIRFGFVRSTAVIAGILIWTVARMTLISEHLGRFTKEEMRGFDAVVAAAPRVPGLRVAYAAVNAKSKYWLTSSMFHSYGFLSAQRSYDGPIEYSDKRSVAATRYTNGPPLPIKHLYNNANWASDPVIWQYDLVLVYRWSPTAAQEKVAREHGTLVASGGDWQLWQRLPR
ncbi:MAG: hypothetical protein KF795_33885 [Labilithrix sp.]|nr:hypothetical protein [Labilithrix sp.]